MDLAIEQAQEARKHGDVPVGAVIVSRSGKILAAAGNRIEANGDPCAHAEILAIRQAANGRIRLSQCTLVVTLEPCLMCAGAIAHARLAGLVFGANDTQCGAIVSAADFYDLPGSSRDLWHLGGVRGAECAALLQDFFRKRRPRLPANSG